MKNHSLVLARTTIAAWVLPMTVLTASYIPAAHAQVPQSFSYFGQIIKPDGTPLESPNVAINIRVLSPGAESCVLFDEQHSITMTGSNGHFDISIGKGSTSYSGNQNPGTALTLAQAFTNSGTPFTGLTCASGNSYTPTANDARRIRVQFNDGSGWITVAQDHLVHSVPYSQVAATLGGVPRSGFLQVNNSTAQLTQNNLESVFQTAANVAELLALINGTSTQFAKTSGATNFTQAVTFAQAPTYSGAVTTGTQLVNKSYCDANIGGVSADPALSALAAADNGKVLQWTGTKWVAASVTGSIASLTGDVTATGTGAVSATIAPNAVTGVKIAPGAVTNVHLAADIDASKISTGLLSVMRGGTGSSAYSSNQLIISNATGTALTSSTCSMGQTIQFGPIGEVLCVNPSFGTVTSINAGSGLVGGPITSSGVLSVDAGTGPNQIVKLDGTGRIPSFKSMGITDNSTIPSVTINATGDLGLGTASPSARFDVRASNPSSPLFRVVGDPSNGSPSWTIDPQGNLKSMPGGMSIGHDSNVAEFAVSSMNNLYLTSGTNSATPTKIVLMPSGAGQVGIGTNFPQATLHVAGQLISTSPAGTLQSNSGSTIDWNNGNIQTYSGNCGTTINMMNVLEGGSYTLVVTDTSTTQCNFSASSPLKFSPTNGPRTASTHTIYRFVRVGGYVYAKWESYQ